MSDSTKILLIITGGIAACKSLELIRMLRHRNIDVQCVMTQSARQFATPLSIETLSNNRVITDLFDLTTEHEIGHIRLSRDADHILIAPATANFLAKISHGIADDLASTVALASDKPLWFAPAMNVEMWNNAATQRNLKQLFEDGHRFIGPESGAMACGEFGPGRMSEPDDIIKTLLQKPTDTLKGRKAVVTVGATQEPIDPVRYLSNRSSGKQGLAIAKAMKDQGAHVTVIAGPNIASLPDTNHVLCITAQDMYQAVQSALPCDIFIGCAAVSDWRTSLVAGQKMKKSSDTLTLDLVQNPDILAHVSQLPISERPALVIGFAAETENITEHATAKRLRKGCDWIVANDVSQDSGVMGGQYNRVTLITPNSSQEWPHMTKDAVAVQLVDKVITHLNRVQTTC